MANIGQVCALPYVSMRLPYRLGSKNRIALLLMLPIFWDGRRLFGYLWASSYFLQSFKLQLRISLPSRQEGEHSLIGNISYD
jgi:hypothetical protein